MPSEINEAAERAALERGNQATALMENEAFKEALEDVEKVYIAAWRNSNALDVELRERAHMCVGLLADIRNVLVGRIRAGKQASEKLVEHSLGL